MKKEREEDDRDLSKLILADAATTVSAIPPLSLQQQQKQPPPMAEGRAASTSRKRTRAELGIETERGRRGKMSDMYALLQTMVPTLLPKATRVTIVSETVEYIKELERRRDRLEEMMKSKGAVVSQCSSPDSSLRVTVSGNVAFFGIQTLRLRRGLATHVIMVFEKHDAQVFAANVAASHGLLTVTVTAFVGNNGDDIIDKIIRDFRDF